MELNEDMEAYVDWLSKREGQYKKDEGPLDPWSGKCATGGKRDNKHVAKSARVSVMTIRKARGMASCRIEEPAYRRIIETLNGSWEHFKELARK